MSRSDVTRKTSLRIPIQAPQAAPIPPSLVKSPHLNPESVFRKASSPRVPSVDDEWLRDTVPQHGTLRAPPKPSLPGPYPRMAQTPGPFSPFKGPAMTPGGRQIQALYSGRHSEPTALHSMRPEQQCYFADH